MKTQTENPSGLHARYHIMKIPKEGTNVLIPTDPKAQYFVLRLDTGGSDPEHIKACRIAAHAYADAIQHHLPDLANDLKQQYPLLP